MLMMTLKSATLWKNENSNGYRMRVGQAKSDDIMLYLNQKLKVEDAESNELENSYLFLVMLNKLGECWIWIKDEKTDIKWLVS